MPQPELIYKAASKLFDTEVTITLTWAITVGKYSQSTIVPVQSTETDSN